MTLSLERLSSPPFSSYISHLPSHVTSCLSFLPLHSADLQQRDSPFIISSRSRNLKAQGNLLFQIPNSGLGRDSKSPSKATFITSQSREAHTDKTAPDKQSKLLTSSHALVTSYCHNLSWTCGLSLK